jgi:hypothetical protein
MFAEVDPNIKKFGGKALQLDYLKRRYMHLCLKMCNATQDIYSPIFYVVWVDKSLCHRLKIVMLKR